MAKKRYVQHAAVQHGLVKLEQLELSSGAITKRLHAGTLFRRYRGVYSLLPELTQCGEQLAAVFASGDGSALSPLNAVVYYVTTRFKPSGITVATPTRKRPQGFKQIVGLDPRDIRVKNGIPLVTFERALIDLPLQPEQTANIIHEAAHSRIFSPDATRRVMARTPGRHGKLERAIQMHEAGSVGTRSDLEDRFMALLRGGKLPEPIVNTHIHGVEVDFRWGDYCVEVDGPGHLRPATRAADEAKQARLEAQGLTVVRFTEATIEHEPNAILRELTSRRLSRP